MRIIKHIQKFIKGSKSVNKKLPVPFMEIVLNQLRIVCLANSKVFPSLIAFSLVRLFQIYQFLSTSSISSLLAIHSNNSAQVSSPSPKDAISTKTFCSARH